mmetsp:Transcript_19115/g.60154  ORF Transcript_19115/g.60154 Transcript_19115/m.60154 type:complete len:238 (-) Transcript_19115:71-784(-)
MARLAVAVIDRLARDLACARLFPHLRPVRRALLQLARNERLAPRGQAPLRIHRRASSEDSQGHLDRGAVEPVPDGLHDAPGARDAQALPQGRPLPPPRPLWPRHPSLPLQGKLQRVPAAQARVVRGQGRRARGHADGAERRLPLRHLARQGGGAGGVGGARRFRHQDLRRHRRHLHGRRFARQRHVPLGAVLLEEEIGGRLRGPAGASRRGYAQKRGRGHPHIPDPSPAQSRRPATF